MASRASSVYELATTISEALLLVTDEPSITRKMLNQKLKL
jgi:hypothetical protein